MWDKEKKLVKIKHCTERIIIYIQISIKDCFNRVVFISLAFQRIYYGYIYVLKYYRIRNFFSLSLFMHSAKDDIFYYKLTVRLSKLIKDFSPCANSIVPSTPIEFPLNFVINIMFLP